MERKGATPSRALRAAGGGVADKMAYHALWPFSLKRTLVAVAVVAALGIVAVGVTNEATTTSQAPSPALSRPVAAPTNPAFTRAEEAYIQALWPIHGEVERTTVRVSLGKIFYKTNDLGKPELKARVESALATFRQAEAQISALEPPPSLARAHGDYLAAVRLFEGSALETLKMFDDGNDEHLLAAYPLSQEGSNKIRQVGVRFWQDEFPPN